MNDLALAFVTGVTTGGLSCMAVQGGLLAASIARQIEQEIGQKRAAPPARSAKARRVAATGRAARADAVRADPAPRLSLPILLFLGAKLVAYTILGLLLGAAGSVLQLTPLMRAVLQIGIGVFMIGNALRMLNVHPIFRYFNLEPPQAVTRYIRRTAKQNSDIVTPAFLGLLTVLIPCGVTQAMMALALGTGNPLQGAAIMFSFTLGTTPVFFALAYLATRLGAAMEKRFALAAAAVLLVLGVVSIQGGFALTGLSLPAATQAGITPPAPTAAAGARASSGDQTAQVLRVNANNNGYTPAFLRAKAGRALRLDLVTKDTYSCSRAFVIPALNMQRILPDTGTVSFDIPAQKAGTSLKFTCSMGMYTGVIQFTD